MEYSKKEYIGMLRFKLSRHHSCEFCVYELYPGASKECKGCWSNEYNRFKPDYVKIYNDTTE